MPLWMTSLLRDEVSRPNPGWLSASIQLKPSGRRAPTARPITPPPTIKRSHSRDSKSIPLLQKGEKLIQGFLPGPEGRHPQGPFQFLVGKNAEERPPGGKIEVRGLLRDEFHRIPETFPHPLEHLHPSGEIIIGKMEEPGLPPNQQRKSGLGDIPGPAGRSKLI